jgi:hypothetical protein
MTKTLRSSVYKSGSYKKNYMEHYLVVRSSIYASPYRYPYSYCRMATEPCSLCVGLAHSKSAQNWLFIYTERHNPLCIKKGVQLVYKPVYYFSLFAQSSTLIDHLCALVFCRTWRLWIKGIHSNRKLQI